MSSPSPICILCKSNPPIEKSHIIPAFVIRRLKKGSPLDTLIHSDKLSKTFYDGWKGPYLCAACEQDFSKLENFFCTAVYDPFDKKALTSFDYGPELLLFAASLIFRWLHLAIEFNPNKPRQPEVEAIYENLRSSLLAKNSGTVTSSLYLDFFAPITAPDGLPPGINQYFFRALDGRVQEWKLRPDETVWLVFVKLPGMNFILASRDLTLLMVKPGQIKQAINLSGTMDTAFDRHSIFMTIFGEDFNNRAVEMQENYEKLPSGRVEKMADKIIKSAPIPYSRAEEAYLQDTALLMAYQELGEQNA